MKHRALERRLQNFLKKRNDEFLDGQHSSFWSEFVSQHRKPARGPSSELCTDVSWFAYLSRTHHSQSRGAHGGKRWLNPQAIYEWQRYASVPNPRDVIWRAILPIGVNQTPIQGSATGSGGLNPWSWNPYLSNPLVAMQQFPGGNTQVLSWPPVQADQALPNFLPLATSKGKGSKRREEEGTPQPKRPRVIMRK